jgi:SNF2 family DNA or RNA helicase
MKSEDYLSLPDLIYEDIPVKLDSKAKHAYDQLERDMLLEVEDDLITAANAATLTGKLLQLCNGAVYDENGGVLEVHNCKIEALLETIEQLNGQHAIIYYYFQHDRDRILTALEKSPLTVRVYKSSKEEDDWNAGKIDLLLAQPASCGYGLNLQDGGHHVIWFGLTWALEEYQQANKRLHRQGQLYPVIVHRLVTQGGTDEDVIRSLECKDGAQENLLSALKVRIEKVKGGTQ